MTAQELMAKMGSKGYPLSERMALYILSGKRPSVKLAIRLQEVTGYSKLQWLFPDEFGNPIIKLKKRTP